jgi:RNA polymerase sigma-70 factor (ECF subfamily)
MTDLLQRLEAARPTQTELDNTWAPQERDAVLARVRNTCPPARRRRRYWLAAAAVVGAVAIAPTVVDTDRAAEAAQLRLLAARAASADAPTIAPGSFLHVSYESTQQNSALFGDGKRSSKDRDSWIRWDGTIWAVDTEQPEGWRYYHHFKNPDTPEFHTSTPEYAASLPDEPYALRAHLDQHVSGSSSHEEAIFAAITDLARSYLLPRETWSAALEVLADVDGVETEDVVVDGRPAVEVSYREHWGGLVGTKLLVLDQATGQVIAEVTSDPGSTYRRVTTAVEVVDEVPAQVLETLQRVGDGGRVRIPPRD